MQSTFNNDLINKLPKIKDLIKGAKQFKRDQMIHSVLQEAMNCTPSIDESTDKQIEKFEKGLISLWKMKGWLTLLGKNIC